MAKVNKKWVILCSTAIGATDVEISDFAMHYTEDDVVGLPHEVVQKQSAQVRNVSGATYSTQAFQDAVQDALSQARNSSWAQS